jgi:hypothetical protein
VNQHEIDVANLSIKDNFFYWIAQNVEEAE